jgi:RNA polymerase sigma-70 factor (ECF subfamily)
MAAEARQHLLTRYARAVHRYLLGALHDSDAANDLSQEFALRFIRGDFRSADPARGRFRDFVKGVLSHLIADHHRKRRAQPQSMPSGLAPAAPEEPMAESDRQFLESWRDELFARTWEALQRFEARTGQPFHTVLRFRVDHPDLGSKQLAEQFGARLGKAITPVGMRQMLRRARAKFWDLLLEEVVQTLENPSDDQLEQELIDLGLLELKGCRDALERRRSGGA